MQRATNFELVINRKTAIGAWRRNLADAADDGGRVD
jgi:hypothetical protein